MSMSDPIADLLTRVRNAGKARFTSVDVPGSTFKTQIAQVLKNEGYIKNYKFIEDSKQGILRVYLKYDEQGRHIIENLKRISRPSRRVYLGSRDVKPVFNGLGIAILSTSKGVMTDKAAREANIGGEVVCHVF